MKKLLVIAAIITIGITGFLSGCISEGNGTLILQITDDPGDLNITEALVTLSQISVHYAGINDTNTTGEWINIVNETQTFDLIALQDVTDLLGEANLSAGWYTQIRLNVDQALVTRVYKTIANMSWIPYKRTIDNFLNETLTKYYKANMGKEHQRQ